MPRIRKCRSVCFEPENRIFYPEKSSEDFVTLTVEETEALRLADFEELEQSDCANIMNISRGTFQRILYNARKKTAMAITQGKGIKIDGGNYMVSDRKCNCEKDCIKCIKKSK
ncbi:MAG: DUF134 domain-containing protein [Tyzzerella sp.]|uniref:UPF0251 protein IAC55_06450 n=1 Tax=Candidatus Fimicola merdigallinarum TaxID=2840819 RepID=A0A9D9DVL6_9FIRM|nr:DUF134 domain-containing protein [Candidatus Fimicola merdigallinarum]